MKRKKSGFSLIELMLVVGVVALMLSSVYYVYNKKMAAASFQMQESLLLNLKNDLKGLSKGVSNLANITNVSLFTSGMIPKVMDNNPAIIDIYGNPVTFSVDSVSAANDGFKFLLTGLTTSDCTRFVTEKIGTSSDVVKVNGAVIKASAAVYDDTAISNGVNACNNPAGNTFEYSFKIIREIPAIGPGNTAYVNLVNRMKTDIAYIPDVSDTPNTAGANPAAACTGGSSWVASTDPNAIGGTYCSCPSTTKWNGSICQPYGGNNVGNCPIGQSWTNGVCVSLGGPSQIYVDNSGNIVASGGRALSSVMAPVATNSAGLSAQIFNATGGNGSSPVVGPVNDILTVKLNKIIVPNPSNFSDVVAGGGASNNISQVQSIPTRFTASDLVSNSLGVWPSATVGGMNNKLAVNGQVSQYIFAQYQTPTGSAYVLPGIGPSRYLYIKLPNTAYIMANAPFYDHAVALYPDSSIAMQPVNYNNALGADIGGGLPNSMAPQGKWKQTYGEGCLFGTQDVTSGKCKTP